MLSIAPDVSFLYSHSPCGKISLQETYDVAFGLGTQSQLSAKITVLSAYDGKNSHVHVIA